MGQLVELMWSVPDHSYYLDVVATLALSKLADEAPEENRMTRSRIAYAATGAIMATVGVAGFAGTVSGPAAAASTDETSHDTMRRMMEARHGEDAVERMHQVEGADEMMDQCGAMMEAMGGMDNIMDGGMGR